MSTFWDKRRAAVAAEVEADAKANARAEALQAEADLDALPDEEILTRYDLPDPDALDSPDAVKDFLSHGLPQRLKTRALRRLWRLNPVLANVDGLVDYGEDFTDAATVIENLQTAYQVGKGMLAHVEALAAKDDAAAQANGDHDAPDATDAPGAPDAVIEEEEEETPLLADATPAPAYAFEDASDDAAPPPVRRRMTFQFESQA